MSNPADLYRNCRHSAHRLETLQTYLVAGGEERRRAFDAGLPLPPPGPGKQETVRVIAELRRAGRDVGRVHIVDRPLTPYLRYELAVYPENAAAGEDVRLVDRTAHPRLGDLRRDFAIFDGGTPGAVVVWFDYDPDGRVLGYQVTDDPAVTEQCWRDYQLARDLAVKLAAFTADTTTSTKAGG